MMRFLITLSISVLAATLAYAGSPRFEGDTHADATLKKDALANATMFTSLNGCSDIESVSTTVTSPPSGNPGEERVEERWILSGCGESFPFKVTLTGDGKGAAFFGVERLF
jgi:hypothetical protein